MKENEKNDQKENVKVIHVNIVAVLIVLILIIVGINMTMARFRSKSDTETNAQIAFYLVNDQYQEGHLFLKDLYPREESFDYTFTVSNYDEERVSETSLEYSIELEITTNLPLQFEIFKNDKKVEGKDNIDDTVHLDNQLQSYVRTILIKNNELQFSKETTDTFKVAVTFPIKYNEHEEFQGLIDNVNIKLESRQKIEE